MEVLYTYKFTSGIPVLIHLQISGISSLRACSVARLGAHTLLYLLCTGTLAMCECIGCYYLMHVVVDACKSHDVIPLPLQNLSNSTVVDNTDDVVKVKMAAVELGDFFLDVIR